MSEKNFCESGKHVYREVDIVRSIFDEGDWQRVASVHIVVACNKCDSKFLREVARPLP